jgi:lipopolysaccharide transport system permease protein
MPPYLIDIYRFRGFILGSVKREFSARYRNSMLGAAWLILQPLAQILVYTLIFANVMRTRLAGVDSTFGYSIFLCAGVLTWGLFAEIVSRSQNMFLDNANLLKKLSFPRIVLPVIVLLNACAGFFIIFGLFTVFLLLSGTFPGWAFAALAPVILVQLVFGLGLGINIGVLNVFFRDVGQFFGIALQFWFWLTPVVYPISTLPQWAQSMLRWNPMTSITLAYQGILVHGEIPDWQQLAPSLVIGLALCVLGLQLFRRRAGEMADEL